MAKRDSLERMVGMLCRPRKWQPPDSSGSFKLFVLRNNDIGDLILTTPLFEAIKSLYPNCRLEVGIGDWNHGILEGNPYVDSVLPVNAPWHNKVSCKHSPNSPIGFLKSLLYIFFSMEARNLARGKYDLGIDILGSLEGTLLMWRAGISNRMGVKGYSGGFSGCQKWRQFKIDENAGRSSLRYVEMLGMDPGKIPALKPQLFLSKRELEEGESIWGKPGAKRVVISTGAGFPEKCWPMENYRKLARQLEEQENVELAFLGSARDRESGEALAQSLPKLKNLAGQTSLRQTMAIIAHADIVICNTTMFMHVAAAFEVPTLVMLGPWYDSAKLHKAQWGHPGTTILGREVQEGIEKLSPVSKALENCQGILQKLARK